MRFILFIVFIFCISVIFPMAAISNENKDVSIIKIRGPQANEDASYDYFYQLYKKAIQATEEEYGSAQLLQWPEDISQERSLEEIKKGRYIDLYWAGTNKVREKQLHAVRVPLVGGLLGVRMFTIHKDNKSKFDQIQTLEDLKNFTACQGDHWPDSDIMEDAGLYVMREVKFGVMYKMLESKRCDYFPRAITEGYAEVESLNNPDILAYDRVLLIYPFPMYSFVSKENTDLMNRLTLGLNKLTKSGALLEHMKQHPATSNLFPLARYKNAIKIYIPNNHLSENTNINDTDLWLKIPNE